MAKEYRVIILPEAQRDIRNIILYIADNLSSPQTARNLRAVFQKEINSLSTMPERIKTVNDQPWKCVGVRRMLVKNYYVYFVISDTENAVKIMAIIYAGRDQKRQMIERKMDKA
jgi:plasmid stabilization system protein ParE